MNSPSDFLKDRFALSVVHAENIKPSVIGHDREHAAYKWNWRE